MRLPFALGSIRTVGNMRYYIASVTSFSPEIVYGQIVATDPTFENLNKEEPGIRFWLTEQETWKTSRFCNFATGDEFFPPACYTPVLEIVDALNKARAKTFGNEGKLMSGTATQHFVIED